jgi:hypothetical protein
MERSGPSIEMKVVLLVAAVLIAQDVLLLVLYLNGAHPLTIQIALGLVLVSAIALAAVWGNALSRAIRRLTRACYVARKGDTGVLTDITRTDELGQLNDELNRFVTLLRGVQETRGEIAAGRSVVRELERAAPEMMRSSGELLVSLKEVREGASAEIEILRKASGCLAEARELIGGIAADTAGRPAARDAAARLRSLGPLAREAELLADAVIDEVARPSVDEPSLARAVNALRDSVRSMSQVAALAVEPLEKRSADMDAALRAIDRLAGVDSERSDGARVAELMERSASGGLAEASRLTGHLRRIGIMIEALSVSRRGES